MNTAPKDIPRVPLADPSQRLCALAAHFEIPRADDAVGRSLTASLEFALAARRQLGIEVQLVRWNVRDARGDIDHWAVQLDCSRVLDLTRVGVDGSARLVCGIDDYPPGYQFRRPYPARPILEAYEHHAARGALRMPTRFVLTCAAVLLRLDLRAAQRGRDPHLAASAVRMFARAMTCLALGNLARTLERPVARMLKVLNERPDVHARTFGGGRDPRSSPTGEASRRQVVELSSYRDRRGTERRRSQGRRQGDR